MGTKISALTETGSAPTGAYYPLEYDNANYKISTETLRANLGGKYTADWAQSHGGVTVANQATLGITHNLGTTDVIVKAYVNTSAASDSGAYELTAGGGVTTTFTWEYGAQVKALSSNSLTLQLSSDGFLAFDTTGETSAVTSFANCYIKVVVLSAGAGNSPPASSGPQTITLESEISFTHGLGGYPDLVEGYLTCLVGEFGYDPADRVFVSNNFFSDGTPASSQDIGVSLVGTTTQAFALIGEDIEISNRDTPGVSSSLSSDGIGLSNWKLEIVAVKIAGAGGAARAYIAFDGTGTIAASTEYNIASLTDDGVGLYTVAFTTAITDPVPLVSTDGFNVGALTNPIDVSFSAVSSTSISMIAGTNTSGPLDVDGVYLVVF